MGNGRSINVMLVLTIYAQLKISAIWCGFLEISGRYMLTFQKNQLLNKEKTWTPLYNNTSYIQYLQTLFLKQSETSRVINLCKRRALAFIRTRSKEKLLHLQINYYVLAVASVASWKLLWKSFKGLYLAKSLAAEGSII